MKHALLSSHSLEAEEQKKETVAKKDTEAKQQQQWLIMGPMTPMDPDRDYSELHVENVDGSGKQVIAHMNEGTWHKIDNMAWSRDGQYIAFDYYSKVFVVPADGSEEPKNVKEPPQSRSQHGLGEVVFW